MGKHLKPGTLEPECLRLSRNAVTRKFENFLEEKCQPPTLEPNMPRKHTIYSCRPTLQFTHSDSGHNRKGFRAKSFDRLPEWVEVSGRNRPSDRKIEKNKKQKHFRLCGNLLGPC